MERLKQMDASFLYLENEFNHMSIAAIAIFDGPAPGQDEVEAMVASKLDLVPRYRQRIRFVPFEAGRPVWCDDPHFSLGYHVRHTALPAPGNDEQLQTLVGRVMSQQLDRSKPLWEMWVVEGLTEDRWAIVFKMHHCLADGVAATDLLTVLMDERPDADHPKPRHWKPETSPSPLRLTTDAVIETLTSPREWLHSLRSAVDAPRRVANQVIDFVDGVGTFRRFAKGGLESSLNGPVGPHRSHRWVATSFANIKKIRSAHGTTVNDVVLAAITRGFRDLLLSRDEPVEGLVVRSLVPVSIRRDEERGEVNNRVSAMFADLPVGIADPVERLQDIHEQMNEMKDHHQASAGETLTALGGLAPPTMVALVMRMSAGIDQHAVQTVATNVPGPRHTLYAAGRPMRSGYLYVPLAASVRIGVAMFSYAGQLTFGVTGDSDHAPDTEVLCRGIEQGIEELLAAS